MYFKYPRTYHLPWSPGTTSDDKLMDNCDSFINKTIIVTEKMDGENTNMYRNKIHARSIDSKDHESRSWVKGEWGRIRHEIPDGWRICGENLYAKHSIYYTDLPSYFMVFSIWNEHNECLSIKETLDICSMLELTFVPIISENEIFDENKLKILSNSINTNKSEGFVIRNIESFHYNDYSNNVAKWVREKHITTNQHWMFEKVIPNECKTN